LLPTPAPVEEFEEGDVNEDEESERPGSETELTGYYY
jgi:hypothetical protein